MAPRIRASGSPVKNFFIRMVTRDISLQDCILDLLDNCLDGVHRRAKATLSRTSQQEYVGYEAKISMAEERFEIVDNCGGISIENARDYAFHFGRRPDAPPDGNFTIGLYGIGMKRAILKMGNRITVTSSTDDESFVVQIDVPFWESKSDDWDFDMQVSGPTENAGTKIVIEEFNEGIGLEFKDSVFVNRIVQTIARDYSFFLQEGFRVVVNGEEVRPYLFKLRKSPAFVPVRIDYEDEVHREVSISISAGMAALPPEDESAESQALQMPEVAYYGWFVSCNDRIVLAGNKDERTVWGNEGFTRWHPQYNGFMGILAFCSSDPTKLPWTTTKRDLDTTDPIYRRAIVKMKSVTQQYVDYTTARKADLEKAKEAEKVTEAVPVKQLQIHPDMKFPSIERKKAAVKMTGIQYTKPEPQVRRVAEALGNRWMSNREVGIRTFDYFCENEIEE